MWFQYHPPLRRGDPGPTTHPSSTTEQRWVEVIRFSSRRREGCGFKSRQRIHGWCVEEKTPKHITHPASTTKYCGGSTTLGYLDGSNPPMRLGAVAPRGQGHPSSEGFNPSVTPYPPLTDLFVGRNVVGYLSLSRTQPRLRHTYPRNPVEWPVPDGAGHSL